MVPLNVGIMLIRAIFVITETLTTQFEYEMTIPFSS